MQGSRAKHTHTHTYKKQESCGKLFRCAGVHHNFLFILVSGDQVCFLRLPLTPQPNGNSKFDSASPLMNAINSNFPLIMQIYHGFLCLFTRIDGPSFRTRPSDIESDLEAAATLTCDVEGNPPPQIIWLHEDQDRWSVSLCFDFIQFFF